MTEVYAIGQRFAWTDRTGEIIRIADDQSWIDMKFTRDSTDKNWVRRTKLPLIGAIPIDN